MAWLGNAQVGAAAEAAGRTRRRYYKLSAAGAESAPIALAEATASGKTPYAPRGRRGGAIGGTA